MHLLNVIQCANLGGMEQSNLIRLKGLKALGYHVEVISLNPIGQLRKLLEEAEIPATGLNYRGRGGWRSIPQLFRVLRRRPYDAVLLTGHNFLASAAIATMPAKRKVMAVHFHHFEPGIETGRWPWIYGLAERVFHTVTFCTDFIRDEALSIRPSLAGKSLTVPNPFIVPEPPSPAECAEARVLLGLDAAAIIVGNAGWLIHRKRFDLFLDVAAKVLATMPQVLFVIAGDGPERAALEARADRLGIAGNVVFLGWQPNLATFYKAIDILLFNSDFDALGRTPAEAAAFSVPVVASVAKGGLTELFRNAHEAIIMDHHDCGQLAESLLVLAEDETRRRKLGAAGRARVADYGDLTKHVLKFDQLFS